jgi:hypothetical protein
VYETGDGARLQRPPSLSGSLYLQSDPRRKAQFYGGASYNHRIGQPGWNATARSQLGFNVIPALQLNLSSELNISSQVPRFWGPAGCYEMDEVCTPLSVDRHYIFGQLDSGSISVTSHAAYTFAPSLSLQGYVQLFMARGEYTSYLALDTVGVHPRLRLDALRPYTLQPDDPALHGARDGDGDFQQVALNVNLVLRWEFIPGSTLLLVYSRVQGGDSDLAGRSPRFTPDGLGIGPTEDVFLLKLSYFAR